MTPPPLPATVTLWRDVAERDDYDAEWCAMAPHVVAPPGYTVYRALPAAAYAALLTRVEAAEGALAEINAKRAKADARRAKLPLWGCIWCDASFPRTRQGNADRERHQADCDVRRASGTREGGA